MGTLDEKMAESGDACKWCAEGECWTHGQIEKPEKPEKKASNKKGSSKGSGKRSKGNQGVNMGQLAGLLQMLGGGGGGKGGRKSKGKGKGACKWCQMGSCWSQCLSLRCEPPGQYCVI